MNARRDYRNNRSALFDGIEEGGIRASSSYSSHEIDEHDNERAIDGLQDRVILLKRLSGDINEEVDSHNRMLDRMGNDMDSSRGVLSGTMDRFKMVCTINKVSCTINRELFLQSIFFSRLHWLLFGYYDELVLPFRYLRLSQAGECLHLWHHSSLFS
ncbi:hypothetical protein F2P56_002942 [Juglans regia]|uniref:t-SNARE coiled-coil homology domain-containing protein n=1 Tax=Juglans regia TaxID=51240 RepID=A0A833YB17_JUGRE|nr:hypothetical protein F2P56_002942 [Juglans regia]